MNNNIGIFINSDFEKLLEDYYFKQFLKSLLVNIINSQPKTVISISLWQKPLILNFLKEAQISHLKLEWVSTPGIPAFFRLSKILFSTKNFPIVSTSIFSKKIHKKLIFDIYKKPLFIAKAILQKILLDAISSYSVRFLISYFLAFFICILALFVLLLPFALILYLLYLFSTLLKKTKIIKILKKIKKLSNILLFPKATVRAYIKKSSLYPKIMLFSNKIKEIETLNQINISNNTNNVSCWIVISSVNKLIMQLSKPRLWIITALPLNNIFLEKNVLQKFNVQFNKNDYFICFDKSIQKKLANCFSLSLSSFLYFPASPTINLRPALYKNLNIGCSSRLAAKYIFRNYSNNVLWNDIYLRDFDISECKYILYSPLIFCEKSLLQLIKIYKNLLSDNLLNIKLIVALDFNYSNLSEAKNYINSHQIQFDILFLPLTNLEILASLHHLAILSIYTPQSKSELLSSFTLSYFVETPSLFSSTYYKDEEFEKNKFFDFMMFDENDINTSTTFLKENIKNHLSLLESQKSLYEKSIKNLTSEIDDNYLIKIKNFNFST